MNRVYRKIWIASNAQPPEPDVACLGSLDMFSYSPIVHLMQDHFLPITDSSLGGFRPLPIHDQFGVGFQAVTMIYQKILLPSS